MLIGDDDLDLGPGAALDELGDAAVVVDPRIAGGDGRPIGLEQLEQPVIAEGGHLDRLAKRRPPLAFGERPRHARVDDDGRRLVEGADEVLALGQVDGRLAPDRRVDLGDERRRDVDDRDAAQERRRQEARRVAERAATDRDDRLIPLQTQPGELARCRLDRPPAAWRPRPRAAGPSRPSSRRRAAPRRGHRRPRPSPRARRRRSPGAHRARRRASPTPVAIAPSVMRTRPIGVIASSSVVVAGGCAARAASHWSTRSTTWATSWTPVRRSPAAAYTRSRLMSRSRIAPIGSRPWTSGRTCGDRRRRWARTSGRPSSQTDARPRYRRQRLRGSTTAPPPVAMIRRTSGAGIGRTKVGDGGAAPCARKAGSPSSAKMSGMVRPLPRSIRSSRSMNSARCRPASRRPTTLLPLPGSPTSTTSIGLPSRRRRSRLRPCRSGRAPGRGRPRAPAGATAMRSRYAARLRAHVVERVAAELLDDRTPPG